VNPAPARDAVDELVAHASGEQWSTVDTLHAVAGAIAAHLGAEAPAPRAPSAARPGARRRSAARPAAARPAAARPAAARRVAAPVALPDAIVGRHADALDASLLGAVYERLLHPTARRARGAHFTPLDVARALVAFALDGLDLDPARAALCDPACGGGAFLLAAAEHLHTLGATREQAARAVHGCDIDPLAAWVSATALELWAPGCDAAARIHAADGIDGTVWQTGSFDAVVGNPPFQNQLQRATARSRDDHARAVDHLGGRRAAYVDTAALFLVRGMHLVRPGGRVALVQPHSTLAARDATPVRALVGHEGVLDALWYASEPIFEADVRVCAPVLERVGQSLGSTDGHTPAAPADLRPVRRAVGRAFTPAAPADRQPSPATWAPLVADLLGAPVVALRADRRVADVATATAGFRDEYYGLVGAVRESGADGVAPHAPRLCTSGLIDLFHLGWGSRPARFARARHTAPVIDVDALDARTAAWVQAQSVPKLVVATQSKVIEVAVDLDGRHVACTPVIAVFAPVEQLWHLAAALAAPCVAAHAFAQVAGTALSPTALKLSARQVLDLPLPVDARAWDEGAALAARLQAAPVGERGALFDAFAAVMQMAYACEDASVPAWWRSRIGEH
jgi:hypothetical protein